jgi:predicted Rossmann-fold nucleotide-binding protein
MPAGFQLPYQPLRAGLYSPDELLSGFDPLEPESFARTRDFQIYLSYVREGGAATENYFASMMQSLHDNSITQALRVLLAGKRCVAIMGGHKLQRDEPLYEQVASLSRAFTRSGLLVASGGGPGAMEATHLGAALANSPDEALAAAIARLSEHPSLPGILKDMVADDATHDATAIAAAHGWYRPAIEIWRSLTSPGASLAVPTWHYGHEPTSPLATHIAKYFQNSIREDGLLAIATHGIVFAPGKAGTIQEIFQDATQNYYRTFRIFSPMVLLGKQYWTVTHPVEPLMRSLFAPSDFERFILMTDSLDEARRFIEEFVP